MIQNIDIGDYLLTSDGNTAAVEGLDWSSAHNATAYDFTVDGLHTYYVSTDTQYVLVHNTECYTGIKYDGVQVNPNWVVPETEVGNLLAILGDRNRSTNWFANWKTSLADSYSAAETAEIFYQTSLRHGTNPFVIADGFDWGKYYRAITGTEPPAIDLAGGSWHAHHLAQKGEVGATNRGLLDDAGISNADIRRENLVWAPQTVAGQHGEIPQAQLEALLRGAAGDQEATFDVLAEWAEISRNRR